jgi:hypothetical protein
MKTRTHRVIVLTLCLVSWAEVSCTDRSLDPTPAITLSITRVPAKGWLEMTGSGFTPGRNVTSHLLQPDGREFPELPIMTDSEGRFSHDIDTLLLLVGTHELWVVDDTTGVTSNVARFEVTRDQE